MNKLLAEGTINESQACFIWMLTGRWYDFMSAYFIGIPGCNGLTAHSSVLNACLGVPPPTTNNTKSNNEENLTVKRTVFQRIELSTTDLMNDSPFSSSLEKKQPMKISSTVQFGEPYKSILGSIHISVWGKFICLITERRCRALALFITVRYMNGGESTDSAGQKGGQSN